MGNKPGKTETTAGQTAPWGPAQPGLQMGINAANEAFQSGLGSQPYTASMVVPFAQQSEQAFDQMTNLANQFQPAMTGQFNTMANLAAGGGTTADQNTAMGYLRGLAGNESGLNAMQTQAANWLNPIASGQQMTGNPYLDEVIKRSSADIAGANAMQASAAGRYGSGGYQGVLDKAIADMAGGMRFQDYNTQQQRMDQAIKDYAGLGTTGYGQRSDAIGSLFNAGQTQQENVRANNAALQAAYSGAMMPSDTLRTVGQNYEDLMAKQIQDQRRVFDEIQNQPWKQIGLLNSVMSGAGQMGGTSYGQVQGPGTSRLGAGIGGAISGGAALGPWGALAGGLGGMLS